MGKGQTEMINNIVNRKTTFLLCIAAISGLLIGCDSKVAGGEYIPLVREEYEKEIYSSVQVETGTITPELNLRLKPDEYEIISYSINKDMLEVEEINVERGNRVNAGTVMVVFKNDGIKEAIEEYKNRREEDVMLIEHYTRLQSIDSSVSYQEEINSLNSDISVIDAYIKEEQAKLDDYQIVAERSGVVTRISDELYNGYATKKNNLINVVSGSSNYVATTSDDYKFEIDAEYEATSGVANYTLKLIEIEEVENGRRLTFEPVSDMSAVAETDEVNILIKKPEIKNAIYVDENAITTIEDKTYLFTLDDDGYRHAVEVKVDNIIDGYAILEQGIEAGEWVTIQ